MTKPMYLLLGLLCITGAALATPGKPDEAAGGKPVQACDKQQQQCAKQCDKEKNFWFFKGEAYETCAAKCDARYQACMDTGHGGDSNEMEGNTRQNEHGQTGQEMRTRHANQQDDQDSEDMDADEGTAAQEMEESEPPADEEADATADDDNPAADKARGKGKKKDD